MAITDYIDQNAKYYVDIDREQEVSEIASEIMATGIKEKDAYHVASAIFAKCEYFISTDKRLSLNEVLSIRKELINWKNQLIDFKKVVEQIKAHGIVYSEM